jgi:hypothetical protein
MGRPFTLQWATSVPPGVRSEAKRLTGRDPAVPGTRGQQPKTRKGGPAGPPFRRNGLLTSYRILIPEMLREMTSL